MCLLITKPANTSLDSDVLARAYQQNSDGLGIAYYDGDARHVVKTLPQNAEDAIAFCAEHAKPEYTAMVHFRFATHGAATLENQHPFSVPNTDLVLAHNGVMPYTLDLHCGNGTDTWAFVRQYLVGIVQGRRALQRMRSAERALAELIGTGNKLAAMDARGNLAHVNRNSGVDHAGIWYSNSYALTKTLPARMQPSASAHWWDTALSAESADNPVAGLVGLQRQQASTSRGYAYLPSKAELWDYAQTALEDFADEVTFKDFEHWLSRYPDRFAAEIELDSAAPIDLAAAMLGVVFDDAAAQAYWSE
jgi:hypothetical protein